MTIPEYNKYTPIGISLPTKIVEALDKKRKDVARSRYILRVLENDLSNNNQTVLDPMMGSGTAGLAALTLRRKFIGIEKEEEIFKIAEDRLENRIK